MPDNPGSTPWSSVRCGRSSSAWTARRWRKSAVALTPCVRSVGCGRHPARVCTTPSPGSLGTLYQASQLPPHVSAALYNLAPDAIVPGHQLVFYCYNYGTLAAVSYASGLPWLDLYQASSLRGWRPRSRGLLQAAMRARAIA